MATKTLLVFALSLLVYVTVARQGQTRLSEAQQCWLKRMTASGPSQRFESEGGTIESWDENEEQFQCAGVAATKNIIRQNALSVPTFLQAPQLIYIEQGRGLLGITHPGCAETFDSQQSSRTRGEEQQGRSTGDQHQKVHRIRQGDLVVIPAGAAHWTFNDGDQELICISVIDLNNQANQLDLNVRAFQMGGGQRSQGQKSESYHSIFRGFDEELMAEAYNIPREIMRRMQQENNRGIIVNCQRAMRIITSEEEEGMQGQQNGAEETICTMKIKHNLNNQREADIYSRQAGRINIVNRRKLPILLQVDMSAERGTLLPNALHTPHWSMTGHSIVYVIRGEAQVQIVGDNGERVFDEEVSRGNMFVIPQYFATIAKAGSNGFEWVAIKTSSKSKKVPMAGYTSVIRAMPLQVITNSYQCSPSEAQILKYSRGHQTFLLSPSDQISS